MYRLLHKRGKCREKWFLIFLFTAFSVLSQTYTCVIQYADTMPLLKKETIIQKEKIRTETVQKAHLRKLNEQGFLMAGFNSIQFNHDSSLQTLIVQHGPKILWAHLSISDKDKSLLSRLKYDPKQFHNAPCSYKEFIKLSDKIVSYYENMGYPFTSVKLDSLHFKDNRIAARLVINKNTYFKLDSIVIIGNAKINKNFLEHYLDVKEGGPYHEKNLKAISGKLKQLAFLFEKQPQQVRLTDKTNKLLLFLDKKNASQFDGIIGILPDNTTGKTVFTGDVKIKLVNSIFRNGETFDLEWRRLQTQTQDFKGRIIYPYLFNTPVGTDYSLKIYRKDSSFIDLLNNVGLQYYFSGLNYIKAFYKNRTTNLISTSGLQFISTLPDYADITTQSYGLGGSFEALDYRFNPHKGISISLQAGTGTRSIKKNPKVNDLAYRNVQLLSNQNQIEGEINWFIPVKGHNIIHVAVQSGGVFGNSTLFRNELFRIGGLKTLRGFDEESIYASTYIIPTLEYRYLFARNSNLLVFMEGAWYENNSLGLYKSDTPLSFGAGINFETKAGILTLNYGIGNQQGNGFDFRNGKIHFGLTALF
ncbi:MAG: ShlB/FhaC/HecB family hemolysin secretion/activation protein [Sediminibacterium sp.]|nr:ShlB/FhaC/HecB family hemolysin secretion/activation protein [Sediminibacterium sp.]